MKVQYGSSEVGDEMFAGNDLEMSGHWWLVHIYTEATEKGDSSSSGKTENWQPKPSVSEGHGQQNGGAALASKEREESREDVGSNEELLPGST